MKERDIIEALKEDIIVPDIVQKKADMAFAEIREQAAGKQKDGRWRTGGRLTVKKIAVLVSAAVLLVGGICMAAGYRHISRSSEKAFHISGEQKAEIESLAAENNASQIEGQEKLVDFPEVSAVDQGITVSLQECIADNYCARIVLRVEGYKPLESVEAGQWQPGFGEKGSVLIGGELPRGVSGSESFYNGSYLNEEGKSVNDEEVNDYRFADGSMEYVVTMRNKAEKGYFLGKTIHMELKDLGHFTEKAGDLTVDVEGTWTLDWTFSGTSESYEADLENCAVGDTGLSLVHVELSPISARVILEGPVQTVTEEYTDDNGETAYYETWEAPTALSGVKMKDGSVYYYAYCGETSMGYRESRLLTQQSMTDRILKVDEIEALLFQKEAPGEGDVDDDDFYFVPLR